VAIDGIECSGVEALFHTRMNVEEHISRARAGLLESTRRQLHVNRFLDTLAEEPVVVEPRIAGRERAALGPTRTTGSGRNRRRARDKS
jgi:hypothetical protein